MKRITTLLLSCLVSTGPLLAQQGVTQCGTPTGQAPFPIQSYKELPDPVAPSEKEWAAVKAPQVQWGNTDTRYAKHAVPVIQPQKSITLEGWRGEKLHAQAVVWTGTDLKGLNYSFSEFKNSKGDVLPADAFSGGFVRYVMTDELNKDGRGGCGYRPDHSIYDSLLVADPIDHLLTSMPMEAKSTQAIWINCQVPQTVSPGVYRGTVEVKDGDNRLSTLKMDIKVSSRVLPAPSQWAFHLDLWQSPFAVARYYGVQPWSKEHFALLKKELKPYADAGGKVVTASIIHQPWNAQTYDPFETMVTWMKRVDGTWMYDYTVFDRWVEFMRSMGVTRAIGCYSMIPWRLSFQYYDQATNSLKELHAKPGEQVYRDFWLGMLKDFAAHLKSKGWFDITHIAMDERPMKDMQEALSIIREADADFKVSLAGALHDELSDELDDYCVALRMKYSESLKRKRRSEGKITTYYTCCEESYPNTYTFSNPAEAEWLGWYAAKENLDGYLRWALNSWTIEPLLDSRFYSWGAGDTYLLYPGGRTSMRFENLLSGIQAYEKIRILKQEWERNGNVKKLAKLERILRNFNEHQLKDIPADRVVEQANLFINTL